jgi:hypothetical protein
MNTSYEQFNNSSAGVKLPYERPSAILTSPKQENGFVARGNYPSDNYPCPDTACGEG